MTIPGERIVVIEASAYESLKAAYDELVSYMPKVPTQSYEREMAQEIARLRVDLAIATEALERIERSSHGLHDEDTIAREALAKLKTEPNNKPKEEK